MEGSWFARSGSEQNGLDGLVEIRSFSIIYSYRGRWNGVAPLTAFLVMSIHYTVDPFIYTPRKLPSARGVLAITANPQNLIYITHDPFPAEITSNRN